MLLVDDVRDRSRRGVLQPVDWRGRSLFIFFGRGLRRSRGKRWRCGLDTWGHGGRLSGRSGISHDFNVVRWRKSILRVDPNQCPVRI